MAKKGDLRSRYRRMGTGPSSGGDPRRRQARLPEWTITRRQSGERKHEIPPLILSVSVVAILFYS